MSGNLAQARARDAAQRWLKGLDGTRKYPDRPDEFDAQLAEAYAAGHEHGERRFEPAWRELSDNLEWVQKAGKPLTSIHPRCLGMNLAAVASDLVAAAYPSLRVFIGTDGAGVKFDAPILMRETAELLRGYEKHHRDQAAQGPVQFTRERIDKAERNALAAGRLEAWLNGDRLYPIVPDGSYAAHASFRSTNPAEVLRGAAERMAEKQGLEVDHEAFDEAAARLDEPVETNVTPLRRGKLEASNVRDVSDPAALAQLAGLAIPSSGKPVRGQQLKLLTDAIGLMVSKSSGDYAFDGEVRAVVVKRSGAIRYVVEDGRGLLLIMNAAQAGLVEPLPER